MSELVIAPATHVIITYTKIHYFITEAEHKTLQELGFDQVIQINGSTVMGRNIADVLPIQKYYETFPEKRPDTIRYPRDDSYKSITERANPKNGLASMIRGLKRFMDEEVSKGIKTPNAQVNYDRLIKKYNHLYR